MIRTCLFFVLCCSCGQAHKDAEEQVNAPVVSSSHTAPAVAAAKDTTVKFLWRVNQYDEELKDSFSTIVVNKDFCKTISDPEKAALAYVATYIGSECQWDGEANDDRSNLSCKILSALDLGYQCSEMHLGFLKKWFREDREVIKELEYNCPVVPFTAGSQQTFDEITLIRKGNHLVVQFGANGVNLRMGEGWSWTESDYFQIELDHLKLIKKEKSPVEREHFKTE